MEEQLDFATKLAYRAGEIIRSYFRKNVSSGLKDDKTPVTEVDVEVNELIISEITKAYPGQAIYGEERQVDISSEYVWLCDPIDGTKTFVLGLKNNVFMLALTKGGAVLLSVVYDPHEDLLYSAVKDGGAFCNGKPIRVNDLIIDKSYVLFGEADAASLFAEAARSAGAQIELVPGTGFKCMMLASGHGSGLIKIQTDFWDVGPGSLIIEEAGGKVTALDGSTLRYDKPIHGAVLSNGVIHNDLLKIVQDNV